MFDSVAAFTKQFTPVEGGYVYYPSRRSGGKLVTSEEYEVLISNWCRIAGRTGTWKAAGLIGLAILIWTIISQALALSDRADWVIIVATVAGMCGWIGWAALAPRRLVSGRPDVAPPRTLSQSRRQARAALNWPFVLFFLVASGTIFISHVTAPDYSWAWWAWTVGSGSMLVAYLWIAAQKLRDRLRNEDQY